MTRLAPRALARLLGVERPHKFGVAPVDERTVDGITFASKAEARRYGELRLLLQAGEITELELQPAFPLVVNGLHVATYIADFRYRDACGDLVVEDVKGMRTPIYRLKRRLLRACLGVELREVA